MIINHKSPTAGARINDKRAQTISGGFYWAPKGATFDTDPNSISLITGRVGKINALLALGETIPSFSWLSSDNQSHTFTHTEFLRFAVALDVWVEGQYLASWEAKAKL